MARKRKYGEHTFHGKLARKGGNEHNHPQIGLFVVPPDIMEEAEMYEYCQLNREPTDTDRVWGLDFRDDG